MPMLWSDGNVSVNHPRERWGSKPTHILVHCRYDEIKGTYVSLTKDRTKFEAEYNAAKNQFDLEAANNIIERCVKEDVIDALADAVLSCDTAPRLVFPHPEFDDDDGGPPEIPKKPTNALPFAYAAYLSKVLGCDVDEEIVQAARVGRTKLRTWLRYLCQPSFRGDVRATQPYILLDDVLTTGGTFAALRSYIIRKGASVPVCTALGSKSGKGHTLSIGQSTLNMVLSSYGAGVESYWLEAFGHEIQSLTDAEGQFLVDWSNAPEQRDQRGDALLQRLRDRVNQAAAKSG